MDTTTRPEGRLSLAAAVVTLSVALTGCGQAADTAAEKLAEDLASQDVDVDIDDDSIKVESDDGSAEFSTQGEVPADFPEAVPLPDADLQASSSFKDGDQTTWALVFNSDLPAEEAAGDVVDALTAAGFTEVASGSFSGDDGAMVTGTYESDDYQVTLSAVDDSTGDFASVLTLGVTTK